MMGSCSVSVNIFTRYGNKIIFKTWNVLSESIKKNKPSVFAFANFLNLTGLLLYLWSPMSSSGCVIGSKFTVLHS